MISYIIIAVSVAISVVVAMLVVVVMVVVVGSVVAVVATVAVPRLCLPSGLRLICRSFSQTCGVSGQSLLLPIYVIVSIC